MNRHHALLCALPPVLTLEQTAALLRVTLDDVITATAQHRLALDGLGRVRTDLLLEDLGLAIPVDSR